MAAAADADGQPRQRAAARGGAARAGRASPWREEVDEYTGDSERFHERHYNEFVSFLPYVQRFLYGEGRARRAGGGADGGDSPMRVFRRRDIAAVRVVAAARATRR